MTNPERRVCLRCGKEFSSRGPYNRICPRCTADNRRRLSKAGKMFIEGPNKVEKHDPPAREVE